MTKDDKHPDYLTNGMKSKEVLDANAPDVTFNDEIITGYFQCEAHRFVQKELQDSVPPMILQVVMLGLDSVDTLSSLGKTINEVNVLS